MHILLIVVERHQMRVATFPADAFLAARGGEWNGLIWRGTTFPAYYEVKQPVRVQSDCQVLEMQPFTSFVYQISRGFYYQEPKVLLPKDQAWMNHTTTRVIPDPVRFHTKHIQQWLSDPALKQCCIVIEYDC